tara:strand:+ start:15845 stop:17002 length:1158 start_codon:yes stop_codon:yes gene_type:complete
MLSGSVLLIFVTGHLLNMAFGLLSLEAVETARRFLTVPWSTLPLSVLLMASMLVHGFLGLLSLYKRNTLNMSAYDRIQLISGLLIIPMLASHIVGIAAAKNLFGFDPTYRIILTYFWLDAPLEGLRQVFVVVIAWVHGCIGMFSWMRLKIWWNRVSWFIYPLVVAVPVLALLGFVEAGKDVIAERTLAIAQQMDAVPEKAPQLSEAEESARQQADAAAAQINSEKLAFSKRIMWSIIFIFAFLLALTLFARAIRLRKAPNSMTSIRYMKGPEITTQVGKSLLEISRLHDVPHANLCRGRGRCGTCRVRVIEASPALPGAGEIEQQTLDRLDCGPDVRLACQVLPAAGTVSIERIIAPDITPADLYNSVQSDSAELIHWTVEASDV